LGGDVLNRCRKGTAAERAAAGRAADVARAATKAGRQSIFGIILITARLCFLDNRYRLPAEADSLQCRRFCSFFLNFFLGFWYR
jgi:hypothetical protein